MQTLFKPILSPFLDRIEGRFRRTLEVLGLFSAIMRTEERVGAIENANRHTQAQLDTLINLQTLIETRVASTQAALDQQGAVITDVRQALADAAKDTGAEDKFVLWLAPLEARLLDMQDKLLELQDRLKDVDARSAVVEDRSLHLLMRQVVHLSDGFSAVHTPQGWLVVPEEEHGSLVHLAHGRAYHEPGTLRAITALLRAGDTAVDAGAHIGLLTIPMARSVGSSGRVIAVEPMPRSAEALRRALALNLLRQVEVRQAAVADAVGQAEMFEGSNSMMASLFPQPEDNGGGRRSIKVEQVRLDDLVEHSGPVSLVKLDVEGAELLALAGMQHMLDRNPEIVVIAELGPAHLTRTRTNLEDWLAAFSQRGLTSIYEIDEESGVCRLGRGNLSPSVNLLFSKPGNPRLAALPTASTG